MAVAAAALVGEILCSAAPTAIAGWIGALAGTSATVNRHGPTQEGAATEWWVDYGTST